jgi:D-amino peptidase
LNPNALNYIKLSEKLASEFLIYGYAAVTVGVPVVFLSGEEGLCMCKSKKDKIKYLKLSYKML